MMVHQGLEQIISLHFSRQGPLPGRQVKKTSSGNSTCFQTLNSGGYGVTGNQEIGLYTSLATLGSVNYTIGQTLTTGFYPNSIPNPDLKWERTGQYDAGIDLGIFNNRVSFTVDYYYKKTTDLIYSVAIPFVSGFGTSLQNIGSVENKGLELGLETNNLNGGLKWHTSFNISLTEIKSLN